MTIIQDQLQFIRSPKTVIEQLANDPQAAFIGFKNVIAIGVLYEIAILLWHLAGAVVTLPAFLKIPEQQYYFYELFFLIPMFLATWLLAAGIAYLISKALGGRGSYDTILGGFGITAAVSAYFTLIPDYVQGVLWTTGWVPQPEYLEQTSKGFLAILVLAYMLAYIIAYVVLYSATIHYSQRLSKSKSVFVAMVAFIGSFAVWITIVR